MTAFLLRRIWQSALLMVGIAVLTFVIVHVAPGGPATLLEDPHIAPDYAEQLRHAYGLDEPLPVQLGKWLANVARLNFGRSFEDNRPVLDKIIERFPASLELSLAGFLLGLLGIPLGVSAAVYQGSLIDNAVRVFTVLGQALPAWWLGLMILVATAAYGVFPLGGIATPGIDGGLADRLRHLALPALILALNGWIVFSRFTRTQLLEVLGEDYVRTARAKGVAQRRVIWRHALRNALLPVITLLGGALASLFSGAVLIETVFSWPGMGRLAVQAAFRRDYPMIMALTIIFASLVIVGNLLADIAYAYADPRLRYE